MKNGNKLTNVRYIGNGQVVDANGEIHDAPEILKQTRHENFVKVEFLAMASMINHIGNKKMKVASYIMGKMNGYTDKLDMTQRELAKAVGVSTKTVEDTLKALRKAGLISTKTGSLMINPKLMMRGKPKHYGYLLVKFGNFGKNRKSNKPKQTELISKKYGKARYSSLYAKQVHKANKVKSVKHRRNKKAD